jgi:hypothetical protein
MEAHHSAPVNHVPMKRRASSQPHTEEVDDEVQFFVKAIPPQNQPNDIVYLDNHDDDGEPFIP